MNAHFSRDTFPSGGWQFYQSQTGWQAPTPKSSTFNQTVQLIIKMRRDNPALMVRHRWSVDTTAVGNELELFTRLRIGAPLPTPAIQMMASGYTAMSAAVSDIKRLAAGAGLLMAWDASGLPPVAAEVSTKRAEVCAACPLNSIAKLETWNTVPVAVSLKERLARLGSMKLTTPSDSKLGLCDAMYCPTGQLTHAPIEIISRRVKPEIRSIFAVDCWILKEL